MNDLRVFIGYDSKEPAAFSVALHSLITRAYRPTSVTALMQSSLRTAGIYTRERKPNEATEFSLTRFLVPFLSGFHGYSLFIDCDVLVQADVWDLLLYPMADPVKAVYCCQHDYVPKAFQAQVFQHGMTQELDANGFNYLAHSECGECRAAMQRGQFVNDVKKFDGHVQTGYPRKNWSSVMLFDNAQCQALTPQYVNTASGLELHRLLWAHAIGALPLEWNHLVGEYEPNTAAKILHYTNGGPWHSADYAIGPEAGVWFTERDAMLGVVTPAEAARV